jgi:hypothetical protein
VVDYGLPIDLPVETLRRWSCIADITPIIVGADGVSLYNCAIHHIRWYRNGGHTDIDDLLPVCSKHHHLVHEGGWHLALDPRRNLTITFPDGAIMTTGPPMVRAG